MSPQTAISIAQEEETHNSPRPTSPPSVYLREHRVAPTFGRTDSFSEMELRPVYFPSPQTAPSPSLEAIPSPSPEAAPSSSLEAAPSPSLEAAPSPSPEAAPSPSPQATSSTNSFKMDPSPEVSTSVTPETPGNLESSPRQDGATEFMPNFRQPYMNRFRVVACCLMMIGNGLHDATPGALLTYVETYYDINHVLVSIIFLGNAFGFISAALIIHFLVSKVGNARTLMIAEGLKLAAYVILVSTPPIYMVMIAFFLCGLGEAIDVSICQVFILSLANSPFIQGFFQACYGIGAVVGPIIATVLVSSGIRWSRYYLLTLGVAVVNLIFAGWSFWHYERENASRLLPILEQISSHQHAASIRVRTRWQRIKHSLFNRVTLLGGFFIFTYQGAEVSISAWIVSFLTEYRSAELPRIGYVTAGFWGGITVGRFALTSLAHRVGERNFVFGLATAALLQQLIMWHVPSIPGDSVAAALSGLALGPISPCSSYVLGELIPREMHVLSFSFISSIGSSGGALAPFLTGLLANDDEIYVLHPICIALLLTMVVCWFFLPKVSKRSE